MADEVQDFRRRSLRGPRAAAFAASPASACSIPTPPAIVGEPSGKNDLIRDDIARSTVAITGRVTKVRWLGTQHNRPDRSYEATIRVSRIYKGMTGRTVRVRGHTDDGYCGFGMLLAGQRLGLLLHNRDASGWGIAAGARILYVDLERATGGRSYRPHSGD